MVWARFHKSETGSPVSPDMISLKPSAILHPKKSPDPVAPGSMKDFTMWSRFRDLDGDERLDPRIPFITLGPSLQARGKQLWMRLKRSSPAGIRMKFPSW